LPRDAPKANSNLDAATIHERPARSLAKGLALEANTNRTVAAAE